MSRTTAPHLMTAPAPAGTSSDCPCGWSRPPATDRQHMVHHLHWAHGVPIPNPLLPNLRRTGIAVVTTTAPAAWRHLAYRLARLAQRDSRADGASFPRPHGPGQLDALNTRALLYHHDNRILGYLAVDDSPCSGRLDLNGTADEQFDSAYSRTTIGLLFVTYHCRRRGIGRALVHAAADHAHTTTDELSWWTPLSDAGRALAQNFAGPDGKIWAG